MTVAATFAATLVDEWVRHGLTDAVIAPGSRSTPLALALVADGRVRHHVLIDERSAGFFALGLGLATGRPAVVLTTSGTAAVELHPAVVEADLARVPLIACTADRPAELHHVGAPQTVEQHGLFGGATRGAFDPGPPAEVASSTWRSMASRAYVEAACGPRGPGPVHVNLPFREPLVGDPGPLPPGRTGGRPWHTVDAAPLPPPPDLRVDGARGLIVCGGGAGAPAAIAALASARGWPVLADPRSGARVPGDLVIAAADALLRVPEFAAAHRPEVVLHLGQPWASRVVNDWLAGCGAEHVVVDPASAFTDPDRVAATFVRADPEATCRALTADTSASAADPSWAAAWAAAETAARAALAGALAALGPGATEPTTARDVLAQLPDGANLVVSSSMPVRDVEWYSEPREGVRVLANRGANGIDGVVSTALGVAASGSGPTACLIGDLAFIHDSNGLLAGGDCVFVVVDNGGGGIFSFLPQATAVAPAAFERIFGTPPGIDVVALAAAYGVRPVASVADGIAAGGITMVHVRTEREANALVHSQLHDAVAAALRP